MATVKIKILKIMNSFLWRFQSIIKISFNYWKNHVCFFSWQQKLLITAEETDSFRCLRSAIESVDADLWRYWMGLNRNLNEIIICFFARYSLVFLRRKHMCSGHFPSFFASFTTWYSEDYKKLLTIRYLIRSKTQKRSKTEFFPSFTIYL